MHYRRFVTAFFLVVLAACATLKDFDDPVVELVGIKPLPPQGFEQRIQVTLRVINPNQQAFTIEGIYSELSVQGKDFLKGVSSEAIEVPAYGEQTIDLEASMGLMKSINLFKDLMMNPPTAGLSYELSSKLSIKEFPGTVRVNKEGTFNFGMPSK
jgi:LEA14-like dessication related protein